MLAKVTKVKRSYAEATALEVVRAGAARRGLRAHCPACGGCRFQDLAHEAQLEAKTCQLADALARIGSPASSRNRPSQRNPLPLPQQA